MNLAYLRSMLEAERMDTAQVNADDVFLDAVECVVMCTLERIGPDHRARFAFFRRLVLVAQEEAEQAEQAADSIGRQI